MQFLGLLFLLTLLVLSSGLVSAHCPLCTGAIAAVAISAKFFGVDLSLIGLLIGAFGVSTGLWLGKSIKAKFKIPVAVTVLASFFLTVLPIFGLGESSHLVINFFDDLWIVDKMIFGSVIGGITSLAAFQLHGFVKQVNGRVLFPFQGIAFTLGLLGLVGLGLIFGLGV